MKIGLKGSAFIISLALSLGANAMDQGQAQAQQGKGEVVRTYDQSKGEGQTNTVHLADHEVRHREHNQTTVETVTDVKEDLREEAWSSSDSEEDLGVGKGRTKTWKEGPKQNCGKGGKGWTKK